MALHYRIAQGMGYELIRKKRHPTLFSHLLNVIRQYEIDLVLDVGANEGQFVTLLRKEGYDGIVHSFEPVAHTFDLLAKRAKSDRNWFVHNVAMGDVVGTREINVTRSSVFASLLETNDFGNSLFGDMAITHKEVISIVTVDEFLDKQSDEFINRKILLKMDTQGYDLQVFSGAKRHKDSILCVMSELSLQPIYAGIPHYLDVLKVYGDGGYAVSGFYPVVRRKDLSLVEVDCVLINASSPSLMPL